MLRRRFRRSIEEAILAGVVAPNHTGRVRSRRAIGEKPKLWEARVASASNDRWDGIIVRPPSFLLSPPPLFTPFQPMNSFPQHTPCSLFSHERMSFFLTCAAVAVVPTLIPNTGPLIIGLALIHHPFSFFLSPCPHYPLVRPASSQSRARMRLRAPIRAPEVRHKLRRPRQRQWPRRSHFTHRTPHHRVHLAADAYGCSAHFLGDKGPRRPRPPPYLLYHSPRD